MATSDSGGCRSVSRGSPSKSKSVKVSSPAFVPFICEAGRLCEGCMLNYHSKREAAAKAAKMKMQGSNTQSGGVSLPDDESENPSSDPFSISSSGADSLSGSDAKLPQGMETSKWGGVDHETAERCRHGKRPRRLLCWDGNNTGRRYLACPLRGKFNMCDFISWVDDQWPPMFQRVVASIGEVVGKFKKKLDDLQVDLLEAIQLRNDAVEENEAILSEKQEQLLENQRLEREFTMRTRLAQTTCSTLQNRISNDLYDKNMLYGFILCMFRVIVAILFGIALKK